MAADLETQLVTYLIGAHAIENHSLQLLAEAIELTGDEKLAKIYRAHSLETEEHAREIAERLAAHNQAASLPPDAGLGLDALGMRLSSGDGRATPASFAIAAYALENLEIAAYHLLHGVARRAGDLDTVAIADRILEQEEAAAEHIASTFDRALAVSLGELA
ncbi:MAG: DUF892 family protein [Solirubrobacterales bacterium]|nr:DUF892 family protein [Solirubrobacterales bacterium]